MKNSSANINRKSLKNSKWRSWFFRWKKKILLRLKQIGFLKKIRKLIRWHEDCAQNLKGCLAYRLDWWFHGVDGLSSLDTSVSDDETFRKQPPALMRLEMK